MDTTKTSGLVGGIELNTTIVGHSKIDFDRRIINRELLKGGRRVQRRSRRLVARKALSQPGEFPGKRTGALQKAIDLVKPKSKVGFWIKVEPTTDRIKKTGKIYYPAILNFGSKKRNIARRGNYMTAALDLEREHVRTALSQALKDALIPR
jgi:hypothetical protein